MDNHLRSVAIRIHTINYSRSARTRNSSPGAKLPIRKTNKLNRVDREGEKRAEHTGSLK